MEYGEPSNAAEDIDTRMAMTAHHEAGHIVIAAVYGIELRPEGIMLDTDAAGLACYCKQPEDADASRERVIISTFAGHMAQQRLCKERSYRLRSFFEIIFSPDWIEARGMIGILSTSYWAGRGPEAVQQALEDASEQAVERNWSKIQTMARALLDRDWKPLKPLKSGQPWSAQAMAKYVVGEEVVAILSRLGIAARISEC
jgi:hypothetical protein